MKIIDTHCHLYAQEFDEDRNAAIIRAKEAGVNKILLPNIDLESISGLKALVASNPNFIYPMMGLHPCSVTKNYIDDLATIKLELSKIDAIAVGEIGIDLFWDKSTYKIQESAFLEQCNWAIDYDLPVVIHSRDSIDIIIELVEKNFNGKLQGVFHCFGGTADQAQRIIELGMYMGIGGVITFKNSDLKNVVKNIDINYVMVETDSPYLAPVPNRGKRNESAYITAVVGQLAESYGLTEEEVGDITTANALKLFKL